VRGIIGAVSSKAAQHSILEAQRENALELPPATRRRTARANCTKVRMGVARLKDFPILLEQFLHCVSTLFVLQFLCKFNKHTKRCLP
jgi:hypothetical protein